MSKQPKDFSELSKSHSNVLTLQTALWFLSIGFWCFVIIHALSKVLNYVLIEEYLQIKLKTEKANTLWHFASTLSSMSLCLLVITTCVLKHFGVLTETARNVPSKLKMFVGLLSPRLSVCLCFIRVFQIVFLKQYVCISARLLSPCSAFWAQLDALFQESCLISRREGKRQISDRQQPRWRSWSNSSEMYTKCSHREKLCASLGRTLEDLLPGGDGIGVFKCLCTSMQMFLCKDDGF